MRRNAGANCLEGQRGEVHARRSCVTQKRRGWRDWHRWLLACGLVVGLLAFSSAPASALIHRGHVFSFSFGAAGSGAGQFEKPSGVAVDEASGELYVVDAGNERVEIFSPDGTGGYAFDSEFKVRSPTAIAVDNATAGSDETRHDVYVVGSSEKEAGPEEHEVIYEYSPTSKEVVRQWSIFKAKVEGETEELELENISGVSIDANGVLWVYWETEGVIDGFSKQLFNNGKSHLVWEPALKRTPEIEFKFECAARQGFVVAPSDDAFYTAYERENSSEECPGFEAPDPTVVAKLDGAQPTPRTVNRELVAKNTTGVAVDSTNGDVYFDNATSIGAFTASGLAIQRFGSGHLSSASGIALDSQRGQVFVAEPSENKVVVFGPEEASGPPVLDALSSENLTPSSTELRAQADPQGLESEYHFQFGTSDCAVTPASCTDLPAGKIAPGFGDQPVHVVINGLTPATAYYYRLIVTNTSGTVVGVPSPNTFTTLPSPGLMPDGRGWEMVSPPEKHGAAVEVIARFRGGSIQAAADGSAIVWLATGPVLSEPQGNRSLELTQLLSRRSADQWSTTSLETPHEKGRGLLIPSPSEYHFFSPDLSQTLLQPTEPFGTQETPPLSPGVTEKTMYVRPTPPAAAEFTPLVTPANNTAATKFGGQLEFLSASSDLKHVIFESKVGLTAAAPSAAGLYEWEAGAPLRLVSVLPDGNPAPDEPSAPSALGNGGGLNARGAISSNGARVFWTAGDEKHLYLRDVDRGETIAVNAAQGHEATEPGPEGHEVPEPSEESHEVHFQSASSDGSKVFFTDTTRLTENSSLEPGGEEQPADLYEFELTSAPGEPLRGRIADLTADSPSARADVLNLIPGSGDDGARVYFMANGLLAPGAIPGECVRNPEAEAPPPPASASCNLYVSEPDPAHPGQRETRFIAALSQEDAADWGAGSNTNLSPRHGNLSAVTSRVSPNGRYLTFMSQQRLTGYDNRDAISGEADEEVYLYDASTHRLLCSSCNSAGSEWQRPHGVFDTENSGEGVGLLVDRPELWRNRWLAASIPGWAFNFSGARPSALYQARYLTDNGRLFFDSADSLVAQDVNGKQDVYEYEPEGVGHCSRSAGCVGLISTGTSDRESTFLDASEDGNDVFFLTAAQLVPSDTDSTFDIYDAHVCDTERPCISAKVPSTEECTSASSCHGAPAPTPVSTQPASSTFTGPGNTPQQAVQENKVKVLVKAKPLTRAQKLAKALKACRKLKSKHKRSVCEAQAKKRYGAKSKSKGKAKKTTATHRKGG